MNRNPALSIWQDVDRGEFVRILIGVLLLLTALFLPLSAALEATICLVAYVIVGGEVLVEAARRLRRGDVMNEFFLMSVATLGAMALGDWPEGVTVMLFYLIGEFFQGHASRRSRRAIAALVDLRPEQARCLEDGRERLRDPADVAVGTLIRVLPGERVALDGVVVAGAADVDTSAMTGEALPRSLAAGDEVLSGYVSTTGILDIRVNRSLEDSAVSRIIRLVSEAEAKKARTERLISRFARYYTPVVVLLAALIALFLPLLFSLSWTTAVKRALIFLVISCPCALVLSIPLTFFAGIGRLAREGILVKGGHVLEDLSEVERVVFDKTGTLTTGRLVISELLPQPPFSENQLLALVTAAERPSGHPLARALTARAKQAGLTEPDSVTDFSELPGHGVRALVEGRLVLVGNERLLRREGVAGDLSESGTAVYVAVDGKLAGTVRFADEVRPEARPALQALRHLGLSHLALLSGDGTAVSARLAADLGLDEGSGGLLPEEKAARILEEKDKGRVLFVGDGINDAPVLATADVGVAMGEIGSDAAVETADVVLMGDDLTRVALSIQLARRTRRLACQNIALALGGKLVFLVLGALGLVGMWGAVFADTGLALLTVVNALRILHR